MPSYVNVDSVAKSKTLQDAVKSAMLDMAIAVTKEDNTESPNATVYNKRVALAKEVISYQDKYVYEATRIIAYNQPTIELDSQATMRYLISDNPSARNVFTNKAFLNDWFQVNVGIWEQIWDTLAWVVFADYL